jgi:hypothetical protein
MFSSPSGHSFKKKSAECSVHLYSSHWVTPLQFSKIGKHWNSSNFAMKASNYVIFSIQLKFYMLKEPSLYSID